MLLLGICLDAGRQSIVTEFVSGSDLFTLLHRKNAPPSGGGGGGGPGGGGGGPGGGAPPPPPPALPWGTRLAMARSMAAGMRYLHDACRPPILHQDLKSQNVLCERAGGGAAGAATVRAKICDFGLSRLSVADHHHAYLTRPRVGTIQWAAPEVLRGERQGPKADVYSFGVILWELCTLRLPFDRETRVAAGGAPGGGGGGGGGGGVRRISPILLAHRIAFEGLRLALPDTDGGVPANAVTAVLRGLVEKCFADEPRDRPSFARIVQELLHATDEAVKHR